MTRREMLVLVGGGVIARCANQAAAPELESGRLVARPHTNRATAKPGLSRLGMGTDRDGFIYVPRAGTLPLVVMLHGATGAATRVIDRYRPDADELGFIILAPDSRDRTWDRVHGEFGDDVRFIDRALERVFNEYPIDRRHLAVGGFSDGASYALSLGVTNGDLFTHVLAFSPGFIAPATAHGLPRIFVAHGTEDDILPIERTSRRLVPRLRDAGYPVDYEEFDGPHTVPHDVARRGFMWFLSSL
jgi:phospholipase/carboxylesterase